MQYRFPILRVGEVRRDAKMCIRACDLRFASENRSQKKQKEEQITDYFAREKTKSPLNHEKTGFPSDHELASSRTV